MEDADSGQPKAKKKIAQFSRGQKSEKCIERAESLTETLATQAKKKKTEKGNEKRWWYVELFFLLYHVCVCHLPLPNNSSY